MCYPEPVARTGSRAGQDWTCSTTLVGTNEENIIQNFFCFIQGGAGDGSRSRTFPPAPAPTEKYLLRTAPAPQHWLKEMAP